MGVIITCLVLHVLCTIVWATNAIISNKKTQKILYAVCSILWGICVVFDIANLSIM